VERNRILVMAAGSLGDAVITLPALHSLQARGDVTVAGTLHYLALGPDLMGVSGMTGFEMVYERVLTGAHVTEPRSFEEIFLFLKEPEPTFEERLGNYKTRVFRPSRNFAEHVREHHPAGDYWTSFLEGCGIPVMDRVPRVAAGPDLRLGGAALLEEWGLSRPVLLHPGSGGAPKLAPLSFFRSTAQKLAAGGRDVLVVWGEAEVARLTEIRNTFLGLDRVRVQPHSMHLRSWAGVAANSSGFVGNDSGMTHLAAACGLPVVAVFGPTDPAVWAPPGAKVLSAGPDFQDLPDGLPEGWI
jgi:heptosyltransferase III